MHTQKSSQSALVGNCAGGYGGKIFQFRPPASFWLRRKSKIIDDSGFAEAVKKQPSLVHHKKMLANLDSIDLLHMHLGLNGYVQGKEFAHKGEMPRSLLSGTQFRHTKKNTGAILLARDINHWELVHDSVPRTCVSTHKKNMNRAVISFERFASRGRPSSGNYIEERICEWIWMEEKHPVVRTGMDQWWRRHHRGWGECGRRTYKSLEKQFEMNSELGFLSTGLLQIKDSH